MTAPERQERESSKQHDSARALAREGQVLRQRMQTNITGLMQLQSQLDDLMSDFMVDGGADASESDENQPPSPGR